MRTDLFNYELPQSFIAQQPVEPRDSSRLLVLHRSDGRIEHRTFGDIGDYLRTNDLLIANDSRVIPARLHGRKPSGGQVELLLLKPLDDDWQTWECMTRGRKVNDGVEILFEKDEIGRLEIGDSATGSDPISNLQSPISALIIAVNDSGTRNVRFSEPVHPHLEALGEIPLPPYITEYVGDAERYQTIYSRPEGSAAAPTAGLHFTADLLLDLRQQGVGFDTVTLHVGLDTFKPVDAERVEDHLIHSEWATLGRDTARRINDVTLQGGRVVAIGTTAVRTLEWGATGAQGIDPYNPMACPWKRTSAFDGPVDLFIRPGYRYRAVDALVTNFHLPKSSLLLMVSAFVAQAHPDDVDAGRRMLLESYEVAKREGYRFFSFGDAMLIL